MSRKQDEASERSRQSVCSQLPTSDTVNAEDDVVEAQRRKRACAWSQREQAYEGARERISAGVVAQSVEGDGKDSLWRLLGLIKGGKMATKRRRRYMTG